MRIAYRKNDPLRCPRIDDRGQPRGKGTSKAEASVAGGAPRCLPHDTRWIEERRWEQEQPLAYFVVRTVQTMGEGSSVCEYRLEHSLFTRVMKQLGPGMIFVFSV